MADIAVQLTIRLLGAPEAHIAGAPLVLHNHKARALLYYLAATGRPHTRDHLATLLWSESPDSNARHSLRSSLYHIRRALHAQGSDEALSGDDDLVYLKLDHDACDLARFRRLLKEGTENALVEAISLYRGPLLQGFHLTDAPLFEEWMRNEESELSLAYLSALQRLASWAELRQSWDEAIAYVQRMTQLDPLSEEAQQRLIGLYIRTGAIGRALRQYHQFEAELRQALGLTPSNETQALFSAALGARRKTTPRATKKTTLPFVGRGNVLKKLLAISQDASMGQGVTVLVEGEDGIGKSRLLDELINTLPASPRIILQGSCSPFDDLLSYGPFIEAFQQADVGDLSDLLSQSHKIDPGEQRQFSWRILQALRILTRTTPLLLTIDDLQWANSATLHLFGFLATRLHNLPVMLVGTVQRAEAIPDLQQLVALGRRRGNVHLFSLLPLTPEAIKTLTHALGIYSASGDWATNTLVSWLYERSGGSPFLLMEMIAQLQAEAILTPVAGGLRLDLGRWLRWRALYTLPETTHDLVAWRLTNLSSDACYLLDVLAVANQPLPFALSHEFLQKFLNIQDAQLLPTIEDLVAKGLLIETANDTFTLPHNLLRETLVHHTSHLRRQLIHRQLASILEACTALQKSFPLRQIALHAVIGEDIERAQRFGLQILDELTQNSASAQAAAFLHQLYDLLAPTASAQEKLRLTSALGQLHQSLGQLEQASFWHRQHLELASMISDLCAQSVAHFELGELALVANDYQAAASAARAGLAQDVTSSINRLSTKSALYTHTAWIGIPLEEAQRTALVARGHRLLGAALAMEGSDLSAAESHLQEAVAAHRLTDNMSDLCATLFELGNVAAQRGEVVHALEFYAEAAHTAERAHAIPARGTPTYLALAYNNFAYHSLLLGRLEAAQCALAKGHALAEAHEMFDALLHLSSTQGEIHLYLGEWVAASEAFQQGLILAEELGNLERQAGHRAGLALAARGQHNLEAAIALLEDALTLIAERGYWHLRTRIQLWLAETLLRRGRIAEAEPHLEAALQTARAHGRTLLLMQGERLHACLLAIHNNWHAANASFANTLERATNLGLTLERARTQAAWGETLLRYSPGHHHGHALLAEARNVFADHGARAELEALSVGVKL